MGATDIKARPTATHQTNGNRLAARFSVGCDPVPSVGSDTTKARAFASMGATTIREQPTHGTDKGNRLAAWFPVGCDSVPSVDSRSGKGNGFRNSGNVRE